MRVFSKERSDLIIGMTLAEIFLLLLFVIWYNYSRIPDVIHDVAYYQELLQTTMKENDRLNEELVRAANEIESLNKRLEAWRHIFHTNVPPTESELPEWIKKYGRGHPPCQGNNVLIRVEVVNGEMAAAVISECEELSRWCSDKGIAVPSVGMKLSDSAEIETFLENIRWFYSRSSAGGKECRFDYDLLYCSKEDYYDGRERFEHYFYPASVKRVVPERIPGL